jgi:hypothetical protein
MIKKLVMLLFISSLAGCGLFGSDSSSSIDPYKPNYTPNYKANYTPNFKPNYGTGVKSGS